MTTEQILRDQLERATLEVVGGADLATSIRDGRRRRRTTRVGLAVAATAVLGVGAVGVRALTSDSETVVHDTPVAAAPAAGTSDFVPGTGVDEALAAVVASHFPALPAPDDVYPSDSHTAGPIPDASFAQAEDWQATYTENGNEVLLITGLPSEGSATCQRCNPQHVAGGTLGTEPYSITGDDGQTTWYFGAYFTRDDGSYANAWEIVTAEGRQTAEAKRHVADPELEALVQDPGLTFSALGATTP